MTTRRPLVLVNGVVQELPVGDYIRPESLGYSSTYGSPSKLLASDSNFVNFPLAVAQSSIVKKSAVTGLNFISDNVSITDGGAGYANITLPAIAAYDETTQLNPSVTHLRFTGAGVTASNTFGDITVNIPGGGGGSLTTKDEGVDLTTATASLNFTGAGVTASNTGGAVTINVPGGGSATPAGVDTQLQYNNAGAFGAAANVVIQDGDLACNPKTTPPTSTSLGRLITYARSIAGRLLPAAYTSEAGEVVGMPAIFRKKVAWWNPPGNVTTVPGVTGIGTITAVGTATARNVAATNLLTRSRRLGYVSAATGGSLTGHYSPAAQYTCGTGTLGGFFYSCRFAFSDAAAVAGARAFVGLSSSVAAPTNVEPSTLTNCFGIAQLSTNSTQLYLVYGGTSAQAAIPLGTDFPPMAAAGATNGVLYQLTITATKNPASSYEVLVERLGTDFSYSGTFSPAGVTSPGNTILLAHRAWRCNNATALAVGIDVGDVYVETDY
jgi:hypothetical protein